ncbi:MAG: bifunctional 3-(3-hydroxy-phenyl)propionate/3-hydroxycinnamic acid hydroxylase [Rhodothermaceae bacterium]|nr:bifunctional 3-(3-hydroxy-phenyl)propionate/3-hydroxycinnamic acid hydroxylase [Rhodothermaceae bacterium]
MGSLLANLLGRYGLRVLVLERETAPYALPRAAHLDDEAMRVLQAAGVHEPVLAESRSLDGLDLVTSTGAVLLRARKVGAEDEPYGFAAAHLIHQPTVERALREGVTRFPTVEVRLGRTVEALAPEADGVALDVLGPDGPYTATARYVVGCDGARSTVREAMASPLRGSGFRQRWLVVDVLLTRPVGLPDRLLQIADPKRPTTYVPFAEPRRRWEFRLRPGEETDTMTRPESLRALLAAHIDPDAVEIERAAVYTFHDRIAEGWRTGRMLLAGDAAHEMPPFLGQGLCAGIRDVHNLAWKLALVVRGAADPALLDSVEAERRPHVAAVTRLAVRMGRVMAWPRPLAGLRDGAFAFLHRLPPTHQRLLRIEGDIPRIPLAFAGDWVPDRPIVPQPTVETQDGRRVLLDTVLSDGFALVGLGVSPRTWAQPDDLPTWATLVTRAVHVIPAGAPWPETGEGEVAVREVEGILAAWAGVDEGVIVVRPDRHAFGVYGPTAGARAAEALREALGLHIEAPAVA